MARYNLPNQTQVPAQEEDKIQLNSASSSSSSSAWGLGRDKGISPI